MKSNKASIFIVYEKLSVFETNIYRVEQKFNLCKYNLKTTELT